MIASSGKTLRIQLAYRVALPLLGLDEADVATAFEPGNLYC